MFILISIIPRLSIVFCFAVLLNFSQGPFVEGMDDLFEPRYRRLGVSLSITLPAPLLGGSTPLIRTYVIHNTGWNLFPAVDVMVY